MRGGPRSGGLKRWLVLHPVPRQEFAEAVLRDVGDAGEDVGKPGLGSISLSLAVVIRLNMKEALHASIDRADLVLSPVATRPDQAERWLAASGCAIDGVNAKPTDAPYHPGERATRDGTSAP